MECQSCPLQPVIDAFVKADNLRKLAASKHRKLRDAAASVQSALSSVCLACAHVTDDDNPSNHGQSFVSLDNDSDRDRSPSSRHSGSSSHVTEYLLSRRRQDVHVSDPTGITTLPPDIEEKLKTQFANFAALSPIDLCLVAHLMGGGTFATFASMSWLPHLPYDPMTLQPIPVSRQAVHSRFRNIVRKIPVLAVIAQKLSEQTPPDTKTRARRFASVSAIGRSNSRLTATRNNPVLSAPASKRSSQRKSPTALRKKCAPANTLCQMMLF